MIFNFMQLCVLCVGYLVVVSIPVCFVWLFFAVRRSMRETRESLDRADCFECYESDEQYAAADVDGDVISEARP